MAAGMWGLVLAGIVLFLPPQAQCLEDDWHIVTPPEQSQAAGRPGRNAPGNDGATKRQIVVACGEPARPAEPGFAAIMERLVEVSGARGVRLYESIAPADPHARPGGCVFYNLFALAEVLGDWMNVLERRDVVEPVLFAIFAHELGHVVHRDFERQRRDIDSVVRELEADRFAGYMLSRLNMSAGDVAEYYRLTGDDFAGAQGSHGNSAQRAEAFQQGWRRAELGLLEQSTIGVGGEDHP